MTMALNPLTCFCCALFAVSCDLAFAWLCAVRCELCAVSVSDFGAFGWLPFVLLGLLMSIGYVVWRYLKDKEEKERRAQGFTHKGRKRTKLEEELQAEIDRVRAEKAAATSSGNASAEDGSGLAPPADERRRLDEIKELIDENPDRPRDHQ